MAIQKENEVLVVTERNFDEVVKDDTIVLVSFYASWSGEWQALLPEYEKVAQTLKEENSNIKLAKIDATAETKLGEEYYVQGFPTIIFFKNGNQISYNGGRTEDEMMLWLRKKTGPPALAMETAEELREAIDKREAVFIGAFSSIESELAKKFLKVAEVMYDIEVLICTSEVAAQEGIPADTICVISDHREGPQLIDHQLEVSEIQDHALHLANLIVFEFTDEMAPKIFSSEVKNHMLFFVSKTSSDYATLYEHFEQTALAYEMELMFVIIDTDVEENGRILDFFGIQKEELPAVRLINLERDMIKFVMDGPYTTDNYSSFIDNWKAGNIAPYFRSEEIPAIQEGPVYKLVGKSFKDVVFEGSKHTFVNFYAPWGDCEQLAPIWEKLAEHYAGNSNVRIAHIDGIENEVEGIKVQSFPTLLYIHPNGELINYNGGRTLEDFIAFMDDRLTNQPINNYTFEEEEEWSEEETEEGEEWSEEGEESARKDEL